MDVVVIANEAIDSEVKGNLRGIICKIGIEKSYDHVNLSFMLVVLERMGFSCKWIRWIRWSLYNMFFCPGKWIPFWLLPKL